MSRIWIILYMKPTIIKFGFSWVILVCRDLEDMQTMLTLGNNRAWILKFIEAGKAAGLQLPEREEEV